MADRYAPRVVRKRPPNAFSFFRRDLVAAEAYQDMKRRSTAKELTQYVSDTWRQTTDRAKYIELADKERLRYKVACGTTAGKKAVGRPKRRRPPSCFLLFSNARRAAMRSQHPNTPFRELVKMIGVEWHHMPAEKQQKYRDEANKAWREYDELRLQDQVEAATRSGTCVPGSTCESCGAVNPGGLPPNLGAAVAATDPVLGASSATPAASAPVLDLETAIAPPELDVGDNIIDMLL